MHTIPKKKNAKTKKLKQHERMANYAKAFMQVLKCVKEDYVIKRNYIGDSYLVKYKNQIYEVHSFADLVEYLSTNSNKKDWSEMFSVSIWCKVVGNIHKSPEFLSELTTELMRNPDTDLDKFNLVLNLSRISENPAETFWMSLWAMDELKINLCNIVVKALLASVNKQILFQELIKEALKNNYYSWIAVGEWEDVSQVTFDTEKVEYIVFPVNKSYWSKIR